MDFEFFPHPPNTRVDHAQHVNMLQELFQLAATKQEQLLTESGPILAASSRANPMTSFKLHMTQIKQFPFQMQISGYVQIHITELRVLVWETCIVSGMIG